MEGPGGGRGGGGCVAHCGMHALRAAARRLTLEGPCKETMPGVARGHADRHAGPVTPPGLPAPLRLPARPAEVRHHLAVPPPQGPPCGADPLRKGASRAPGRRRCGAHLIDTPARFLRRRAASTCPPSMRSCVHWRYFPAAARGRGKSAVLQAWGCTKRTATSPRRLQTAMPGPLQPLCQPAL